MTEKQLTSSSTPPRILGLTGGIGAGKSFVGQMLVEAGLPLMDSDAVARGAYTESEQVRQQVVALLGAEVYSPDGKPRYDEIARKVFAPSDAGQSLLHQLEQIIHPYVSERLTAWAMEQDAPEGSRYVWFVSKSATEPPASRCRHGSLVKHRTPLQLCSRGIQSCLSIRYAMMGCRIWRSRWRSYALI